MKRLVTVNVTVGVEVETDDTVDYSTMHKKAVDEAYAKMHNEFNKTEIDVYGMIKARFNVEHHDSDYNR